MYKFNFKHYLIYFWENYKIGLKEQLEYKPNFYIGIILWTTFNIGILIFGKVLFDNFGDIENFSKLNILKKFRNLI